MLYYFNASRAAPYNTKGRFDGKALVFAELERASAFAIIIARNTDADDMSHILAF